MAGRRDNNMAREMADCRLETPRASGYRNGMSTTGMIGSRLSRVYGVATDVPRDMGTLLRSLDGKFGGSR